MSSVEERKERPRMPALVEAAGAADQRGSEFHARRGSMEKFAEQVALDVLPDETGQDKGFDFIAILEIVLTVIQTVIQKCPAPLPAIRNGIRRPNVFQRSAILKQTQETCASMNMGKYAGRIHRALVSRGPALPEVDIASIVDVAQDDANLLI